MAPYELVDKVAPLPEERKRSIRVPVVVPLPRLELALGRDDLRRTRGVRGLGQPVLLTSSQIFPLKVRLLVELHVVELACS